MGSGRDGEGPARRVGVRAFAAGKFEVTQAEWAACVRAGACAPQRSRARSGFLSNRPVHNVSWSQARQYVAWLSQRTRQPYRLLSEAEWEYAARAQRGAHATATRYSWGDEDPVCEPDAGAGAAHGSGASVLQQWCLGDLAWPVGSFPPNAFGLHDMHGNASEWVEDCWHDDYEGAPVDGSAWTAGGDCRLRVQRGGAWSSPAERLRSAARSAGRAEEEMAGAAGHGGLRVGRSLR
jgi:formylglycine-generating enzyme required for sulfatase activity